MALNPTDLDRDLVPAAYDLIQDLGKEVTYIEVVYDVDSMATGESPIKTEVPHTVRLTPPEPFDKKLVNGTTIKVDDLSGLIAARNLDFVPAVGGRVIFLQDPLFNGTNTTYEVLGVSPIYSGQLVCAYEVHLRRT